MPTSFDAHVLPSNRAAQEVRVSTRSDSDPDPVMFVHGAWLSAGSWET
jgi:hypothetical protein